MVANNTNSSSSIIKDLTVIFGVTVLLLTIPMLGGWPWELNDYVIMGILLAGTGSLIVVAKKLFSNPKHRLIAIALLIGTMLILWAEMAVGIFGSPIAGS